MNLSKMAQSIPPSPTLEITAKAAEKKASGADVISFGAGQPDFDTPDNIKDAAKKALDEGFTKYTPATGINPLKEAVVEQFKKFPGVEYSPQQIIVGNGAKQVLANAIVTSCDPGDEVIVLAPYWVSYPEMAKMAGAIPRIVPLKGTDFQLDLEAIAASISPRTKAIFVNSPSNPTGGIFSRESLEGLAELAIEKDLLVISDEVYDFLTYGDAEHVSIASLGPEIKERTLLVNAVSKKYSMTGWRIGYGAGPLDLIKGMARIQSHYSSNPNSIAQKAAVEALNGDQSSVETMVKAFTERRDYIYNRIQAMPGLQAQKPQGAFYIMVNLDDVVGHTYRGEKIKDDFSFCGAILDTKDVAFVPGGAFGAPNHVRISFATSLKEIERGMDRLEEFLQEVFR